MRILYHGEMGAGHHALARAKAFARIQDVEVVRSAIPDIALPAFKRIVASIGWRLRRPVDLAEENAALLASALAVRPDVVICDNARNIRPRTLEAIRAETGAILAFSSPDDIIAPHNSSHWLQASYPLWDVWFTTKTFNVDELRARGVRRPILVGNMYDPAIHTPLSPADVGPEYEAFDAVFVGTHERAREADLKALAEAGLRVLVHGNPARRFSQGWRVLEPYGVTVRPAVVDADYARAVHHGKIAMCFLRKLNRDQITQRSIELPAMGRAMLGEKTDEHDAHFVDGIEYIGFSDRSEMIAAAKDLVANPVRRAAVGRAGRQRCETSDYSIDAMVGDMLDAIRTAIQA